MPPGSTRILLVGAGRFGVQHLEEWRQLADAGEVELAGVVVRDPDRRRAVGSTFGVATHAALTDDLLGSVDGVDLVTPPDTHAVLVRQCLPRVHVLVEKPLATCVEDAEALAALAAAQHRVLMVGHLFRFHPVVEELKRLVAATPERPRGIRGVMVNPEADRAGRGEATLEWLHLFDLVDHLFDVEPVAVAGRQRDRLTHVSLRYPGPMTADLRMGWDGRRKVRTLNLAYSDRQLLVDLVDQSIVVSTRNDQLHKHFFPGPPGALRAELRAFATAVRDRRAAGAAPGAEVGARLVRVAAAARPRPAPARPRIAVIGGGIFGTTCALELSRVGDVTLFERRPDLLTETSATNQRRHHSGFHYPRSYDTISEIRATRQAFEAEYGDAIDRSFPAYYCTSATGVEIPAERYLAACRSNQLAFSIVDPPDGLVDRDAVSLCVLTDEAIYDVDRLRDIVTRRIAATPSIQCRPATTVVSGEIRGDGSKRLTVSGPGGPAGASFDYLVNATFAGRNLVALWFGFPVEPLRFDLCELLLLRLPVPQVCVTVIDGPFTSLTGTGRENVFHLSHIHDTVSRSVIPDDGLPPEWTGMVSNRENLLRHAGQYLPIVRQATDVQSVWMTRAVSAFARDFDARPTVITEHGFGCWSVLGGKVVTAVANAREIARAIAAERGEPLPGA
jgi:predicted dehydrogenase